jgi:hypothetical protein
MKRFTRLVPLLFTLVFAGLTSGAPLHAADTPAAAQSRNFTFAWTPAPFPELDFLKERLQEISNRYKAGMADKRELAEVERQWRQLDEHRPYRFAVRSEGGPLRELLAEMGRDKEINLSVINAGDSSDLDLVLPAFELRNANWSMLIEVLSNFVATRGLLLKLAGSDYPNLDLAKTVLCVMRRNEAPEARRSSDSAFESFQLADYIHRAQTVDVVVDAIRGGWALVPGSDQAALRIKFHPETKLLLVSGPASATQVARQIVAGLQKKPVLN